MEHIVIIGNGISGVTAARHIRKRSNKRITIISAETKYFFSRTALMYVFMGHMKFEHTQPYENDFWKKNNIELLQEYVIQTDFQSKKLTFASGGELNYDKLILATGSTPNKFGWPGQDADGVQGLYSYQDLELLENNAKNTKRAVIIGGGLIGVEMAEMLLSRKIPVTFLVREKQFWGSVLPEQEAKLISRHLKKHHVDLRFESELEEIIPDENNRVKAIKTKQGEKINCQLVGLTVGVRPNIEFLKGSTLKTDKGILVTRKFETNIPDVYAIGDCAQFETPSIGRRAVEQVWYTGKMMGETLAKNICGDNLDYKPGNWFNSAKFFDIEYQTYGYVAPKRSENEADFYWEHPKGEVCIHFVFDKKSKTFIGVNTFGIRLRHEVFNRWLDESKSMSFVLEHLKDANFDPEFYKQYENDIVSKFNTEFNEHLIVKKKSWKRILNLVGA